jgi:hypothetical protein
MVMDRAIHIAETELFVAAALRGFRLSDSSDGCYRVERLVNGHPELISPEASFREVANLCGAMGRVTLRQAAELDGLTWPSNAQAFIAAIKKI